MTNTKNTPEEDNNKARRHYPPSKAKYAKSHPTTGITTDITTRRRLLALQKRTRLPLGKLMLQGLPGFERDLGIAEARERAAGREEGYSDGFAAGDRAGYERARNEFAISYPGSVCGQPILMLPGSKSANAASEMLRRAGWDHQTCHVKRKAS